jgi:RNA polymerase sigma factor (sigma-70 family)
LRLNGDIVLQLLSYVAQTERAFIRRSQREGIEAAHARGRRFGRPPKKRPPELEDDVDLCILRQAVKELPDREREIVIMRFGLYGHQELTQKEVAQVMGISQSYISRLEKRIMLKLRRELLRQTSCA